MSPMRILPLVTAGLLAVSLQAQSVSTVPVGAVTVNIAAGTGSAYRLSTISFPLIGDASADGQAVGVITGVTETTISNSDANWTTNQLSSASAPWLIQITSGDAEGSTLALSTLVANTTTTVAVSPEETNVVNLTDLGVKVGDTYKIIPADTLLSIFGSPEDTGILGAVSSTGADIVQLLVSGTWRKYYYNTVSQAWLRVGLETNSNNVIIRPDSLVLYNRLADTPLALSMVGEVPSRQRKVLIRSSGLTTVSTMWPTEVTLGTSSIELLPGWVSSADSSVADYVQILVSGTWRKYYHNGEQWLRLGLNTGSDSQVVPVGSGMFVVKRSPAVATTLVQPLPYSL